MDEWRNNYLNLSAPNCTQLIFEWTNPNTIPLFNNQTNNDLSVHYLPEPYWGNTGQTPLEAVVINYNPGQAGQHQHFNQVTLNHNYYGHNTYRDFIESETESYTNNNSTIFEATNKWHWESRAYPIFNALKCIGINLFGNDKLKNYLGLELIPWHTRSAASIGNYISNNTRFVYEKVLLFAANQSRRISNEKLRNTVILKMSGTLNGSFRKLLPSLINSSSSILSQSNNDTFETISPRYTK